MKKKDEWWLPVEVKPGMFSDELVVVIEFLGGASSSFFVSKALVKPKLGLLKVSVGALDAPAYGGVHVVFMTSDEGVKTGIVKRDAPRHLK